MKALRLAAQIGLIALCLIPVGRQLAQGWGSASGLVSWRMAPAVAGSALLLILSSLFLPVAMMAFTHGASRRIGFRDSALAYFASQPMKYLPGSFWILPGRVMLLQRMGHDAGLASGGLLFEMTTQVLSSALVATLLLGVAGAASSGVAVSLWLVLAGSVACATLLLFAAPAVAPALAVRFRLGRLHIPASICQAAASLAEIPLRARLRNAAITVAAFAVMWLAMGASFYLLLVAANPSLDLTLLEAAIGIATLSWLAGFLAPFSPGGIGVREAATVLLLSSLVPATQATLVAVLARGLALAVETAFAVVAWLVLRGPARKKPGDAQASEPVHPGGTTNLVFGPTYRQTPL